MGRAGIALSGLTAPIMRRSETAATARPKNAHRPTFRPVKLILNRRSISENEAGARGANGLSLLLYQGALSFSIWFEREAPIDAMRAAL